MFCSKLIRKKTVESDALETPLSRCLNTVDIMMLGIGHMVGGGIYVLAGQVARNITGPGVVLSFIFAGFASLLCALSYAEFGTWVPRAGSAYTYTYVTMGEIWAFVIGWNILLDNIIGAAATARIWSAYLNSLSGDWIRNQSLTYMCITCNGNGTASNGTATSIGPFSEFPDLFAALIIIIISIFIGVGAKSTTRVNHVFTLINALTIAFIVCYGISFANIDNWNPFLPFGAANILAGASRCFYAYIGFDAMATAAEEAKDPSKALPRATLSAMAVATMAYVAVSATLTLMVPNEEIDPDAALASAFVTSGATWAKYLVAPGALSGLTTVLIGHLFALPRCVYAMSDDGLLFRFLATIHPKTQVPTLSIAISAVFISLIAIFTNLEALIDLFSIGTLLAYTFVSMSVVVLRYRPLPLPDDQPRVQYRSMPHERENVSKSSGDSREHSKVDCTSKFRKFCFQRCTVFQQHSPSVILYTLIISILLGSVIFSVILYFGHLGHPGPANITFLVLSTIVIVIGIILISGFQQTMVDLAFKVPCVPLLPITSVVLNVVLMAALPAMTWARLAVWMAIGFLIYFGYGIRHSSENHTIGEQLNLITPPDTD